ncbi:MAG TPA: DNA recombination protein RmuC, partial [Candidatus Angelobacter sp.]|nr:DNA recombination protein RmuC [Candidatus Angelobacter sp.]
MTVLTYVFLAAIGAGLGFVIAWLHQRSGSAVLNTRLMMVQQELSVARAEAAKSTQINGQLKSAMDKLETTIILERKAHEEKVALLNQMTEELRESFQALSAEALKSNNQT